MSGSDYRFEVEHIFSKSLWDNPVFKAFLETNGYTREMAGNKIALFSDPLFIAQLQQLSPNDPLRHALLDPNSGSGINRHDGGAATGNQLGKNAFLEAELRAIIDSPASPDAKKAALHNLHDWATKLARGGIIGADGKPMPVMGNTNYASALADAYRIGPQGAWIDPIAFDDPGHPQRAAAEAALARGATHYAALDKANIYNGDMRTALVKKISAAFEKTGLTSHGERSIVDAALREGTTSGTNRAMIAQLDAAASRSQLWNGTESYTRLNSDGTVERTRVAANQVPSGEGWIGDAAAEAKASPEVGLVRGKIGTLNDQYRAALAASANYTPEGKLTAAALKGLRGIEKALGALGILATVLDAASTYEKVKDLESQGNTAQAKEEMAAFAGRQAIGWAGGFIGVVAGRAAGLVLGRIIAGAAGGAFGGPIGAIVGGFLAAFFGSEIGDQLGRQAVDWLANTWLTDIFGDLVTRRDPLILDLSATSSGVSFTSFALSNVHFDLDSDGFAERTGWINSTSGFVVMDRNGNGTIDNGTEMFGDNFQNGFTAIGALDSNSDGEISNLDTDFANLRIWQDLNLDGVSQASELKTLVDAGVVSIGLANTTYGHTFRNSAQILAKGSFTNAFGETREALAVSFWIDVINSEYILPEGFAYDPEVFTLPNLRGYGDVPDLWVAMSLDPTLKQMVKDFLANLLADASGLIGQAFGAIHVEGTEPNLSYYSYAAYEMSGFEDIVARWAGIATDGNSYDTFEMQAVLENFLGQPFKNGVRLDSENFWHVGGTYFEPYRQFTSELASRFLTQAAEIAENKPALDLFLALQNASASGTTLTQAQIDALVQQAITAAENQAPLSQLLQHYANLIYDFGADALGGDVIAFIDEEMSAIGIDAANPWGGPSQAMIAAAYTSGGTANSYGVISYGGGATEYDDWYASRQYFLKAVDPDGWITDERHRAATNNHALPILRDYYHTEQFGSAGNDTLTVAAVGANTNPRTLFIGGAGNDTITGGTANDAYVFSDGFGNDTISDAGGAEDEIAFQGGLTSSLARLQFVPGSRTGLLITFEGRTDTVTVNNFFEADGKTRFETLSFADGNKLTATEIRYLVLLSQATSGADAITGFNLGGQIDGLGGDDTLNGGIGADLFVGGTGNDLLIGHDGDDIYHFERGDGQDIIRDSVYQTGSYDTLEFGEDIRPEDVSVLVQADGGNDIILVINGTTDRITLDQTINDWKNRIDVVRFADGTTWSAADILVKATTPTAGDDTFYGSYNNDTLLGGAGNDTLTGRNGNDTLIGGTGNDLLMGNDGDDTYRFNLGDGQDTIRDSVNQTGSTDVLYFGEGILSSNVTVTQTDTGNDIIIKINGTTDQVTLDQTVNDWQNRIDKVYFADGTMWTAADLLARATAPTAGADIFYGGYDNDTLLGGAGNDTLSGRSGDDTLSGGTGNDLLMGNDGADTYQFDLGGGQDIIRDTRSNVGGDDTLVLGAGIAPADVTVIQSDSGNDFILSIAGTSDQILLDQAVNSWQYAIEWVRFANGTVWSAADLLAKATAPTTGNDTFYGGAGNDALLGGAGNDTLTGRAGDDTITGGTGNDLLIGNDGADTYRFNRGDGQDIVRDSMSQVGGNDVIEFGAGIAPGDVTVTQADGGNDLVLKITGTTDQIILDQSVNEWSNRIELVRFADGTVWTTADLIAKATAATPGDDVINGSTASELLAGLGGNDTISGNAGNDTIIGGTGNDLLIGNDGADIYRFSRGDGQDVVRDTRSNVGGDDVIEFDVGISPNDVVVTQADSGNDFVLKINGTTDQIILDQAVNSWQYAIEWVRFADGTAWSAADLLSKATAPTVGDDAFYGGAGDDALLGGAGNDTLTGRSGDDTLTGGTGNDILIGNDGADTYRFDLGGGQDIIRETRSNVGGDDVLELGLGILPSDVTVVQADSGNDFILSINGTTDQIVLDQAVNSWQYAIEWVRFANGTVWSAADLLTRATAPTAGNDVFYGGAANDVLSGAAGNDTLSGRDGNDLLSGGLGNDVLDGGNGVDTVDYSERTTSVNVNLSLATAQTVAAGESDTIKLIENVQGGGGNDTLVGSTSANTLHGGAGDDRLTGGAGNDTLMGGSGSNDVAVFAGLQASYSIVTNNGVVTVVDNQPTTDGNDGTDTINGIEKVEFKGGVEVGVTSPIILDLDGHGIVTTSAGANGARFDMDGDGIRDRTSWIGSSEGFLFLDRDGNGTLSGVHELSFANDVPDAASDLAGLRAFDTNGDGILGADDSAFASFKIWQDANGDGKVGRNEILSLAQAGVASLNLTAVAVNSSTNFGDVAIVNRGSYQRTDGSTMAFIDAAMTYTPGSMSPTAPGRPIKNDHYRTNSPLVLQVSEDDQDVDSPLLPSGVQVPAFDSLAFMNQAIGNLSFEDLVHQLDSSFGQYGKIEGNSAPITRTMELPIEAMALPDGTYAEVTPRGLEATETGTSRLLSLLRQDMASFYVDRGIAARSQHSFADIAYHV